MAGKGTTHLRRAKRRCSPVGKAKFETKEDKAREDRQRARTLRQQAQADARNATFWLVLADHIDPAVTERPATIASARYMRKLRKRLVGELCRLHERYHGTPRTFTLLPRDLKFTAEQLMQIKPPQLLAAIRAALRRAGAATAKTGFLVLGLHGEYDPLTGFYHLHFHGYADGDMLRAVDRLRLQRRFRRQSLGPGRGKDRPVVIAREPLTNLPAPLTYIVQSWWPSRPRGDGIDDDRRGSPKRRRIPQPDHSEWLLWLDQWRIQDMVLMMRLRVIKGRLVVR